MMRSTSVSIDGSAMPARLFEPLVVAAWTEKNDRSASPGVVETVRDGSFLGVVAFDEDSARRAAALAANHCALSPRS